MLRHALVLALCAAAAAALETPLTLTGAGNQMIVVDPAYGSIGVYELTQSSANRQGLRKPQANFIADAEQRLKSFPAEQDGVAYQALRLGQGTKPAYGEMFSKLLPDKPTVAEAKAGKKALRWRALRAEDAFWKADVAYDGVVRAAISGNGQYLLLALPSLHALMLYKIDGDSIQLAGLRNIGPELFLTGLNTAPSPRDLLQDVLRRIPKDREDEARKALGIEDDSQTAKDEPAGPAVPAIAADEPPTPKSELWVGPGANNSFIVVDTLNSRAMLYQPEGLTLASVRDLKVDLVIPGLVGGSLRSTPASEDLLKEFLSLRKDYIVKYGLPTERDEILLLVGQSKPKGKLSPFEGVSMAGSGLAMLNFVDRHVFLTLDSRGGQQLLLASARDYTLDIAVSLLDQEIQNRVAAKQLLSEVQRLVGESKRTSALLTLRQALNLDPTLHSEAETKFKSSFKDADQQAQYLALCDEASKRATELANRVLERKKALEAQRKPR